MSTRTRLRCASAAIALLALNTGADALAQYPAKPIRLAVGFPPGGAVDILARIVAPRLGERLGQQVVVDNRPGAGARLASELVSKAAPDGYTLLMITMSHVLSGGFAEKVSYHPVDSFSPVTLTASTPLVLLVHPSLPVRSVKDMIALAKARPGQLNFGSSGTGAPPHLAGELFKRRAGIDVVHVPYRGSGPAFTELIGGQVEFMFAALPGSVPFIQSGKIRALGVTSARRSPLFSKLPTIAESGLAGYEISNWYGLLGPAGMDRQIVEKLNADMVTVLQSSDVAAAVSKAGAEVLTSTPQEFERYMRTELAKWTKLIQEAGIRPQ